MRQQDKTWLHINDGLMDPVSVDMVLGRRKDVYLLFYLRRT